MAAANLTSFEQRPIKRGRYGPPDVFPQDVKQAEDDLSNENVKQGFSHRPPVSDEYGSATSFAFNNAKIEALLQTVKFERIKLNKYQETGRKKPVFSKDSFFLVSPNRKQQFTQFMQDLATTKPLSLLLKKVPALNKKEELFINLCEFDIPYARAGWFIKQTNAYQSLSEVKSKNKRSQGDPSLEWTQAIVKYLQDQLECKIIPYYQNCQATIAAGSTAPLVTADVELALKQWEYWTKLSEYLYDEGLLDRQEYILWILDILEILKLIDELFVSHALPLIFYFLEDFVQNVVLSRKLGYFCARQITKMFETTGLSSVEELLTCKRHRPVLLTLSCSLQIVTLCCPTSLVWTAPSNDPLRCSTCLGSPLDALDIPPSELPIVQISVAEEKGIRTSLKRVENHVIQRSRAVESQWTLEHQPTTGKSIETVLKAIESLDKYNFDRSEAKSAVETLYGDIFDGKETDNVLRILCEWAVSPQRTGEHRATIVAMLFQRYSQHNTDKPTFFYNFLVNFLDTVAPTDNNARAFANLVLLFSELNQRELFSYASYMCTLISRGYLGDMYNSGQIEEGVAGKRDRHLIYIRNFPIYYEDTVDINQRLMLLHGVGRAKEEAIKPVKLLHKEFLKLSECPATGPIDNTSIEKQQLFLHLFQRYKLLSYHDKQLITSQLTAWIIEQLGSTSTCESGPRISLDMITYTFDLLENALDISGMLEFSYDIIRHMKVLQLKKIPVGNVVLSVVAVLRRYLRCLLLNQELILLIFEGLLLLVQNLTNTYHCSSCDICVIAFIYDLNDCCLPIKHSTLLDNNTNLIMSRIKSVLNNSISPSQLKLTKWDPNIWLSLLDNPQTVSIEIAKQLSDSSVNRFQFVCSAMFKLCTVGANGPLQHQVIEIAIKCAELNAKCTSLSSDWLSVLQALCHSAAQQKVGFKDLLHHVDDELINSHVHDAVSTFTAILIGRQCFSMEDFVRHVALTSLLAVCSSGSTVDHDALRGANLTCSLLLRLLKSDACQVMSLCDLHLLTAAHNAIGAGAVLAVLKCLLIIGDTMGPMNSLLDEESLEFRLYKSATSCLKTICSQDWVREKFLKDEENLFTKEMLLDIALTLKQAHQLLQLICYSESFTITATSANVDQDDETRDIVSRLLRTLDFWHLRIALLELQLLLCQYSKSPSDTNNLLEIIAKCTIELFQLQSNYRCIGQRARRKVEEDGKSCVWLVTPLIAKLPNNVQGKVLKAASQVLETGHGCWSKSKGDKERSAQKSMLYLCHKPFLNLILCCLKGHDDQRDSFLQSLNCQLTQMMQSVKEEKNYNEAKTKRFSETLHLRLSLVGSMFDTILKTSSQEWCLLLVQLIASGYVDFYFALDLFIMIQDMIWVLLSSMMVSEVADRPSETRKAYNSLIKKIKKELDDKIQGKHSAGISKVKLMLPLAKKSCDVVTCESMSSVLDNKGNKIAGFESGHMKEGLQVSTKVRISPWDFIEGNKNQASPLNLNWFGAVRLEKKPLNYEVQYRLMTYHTHHQTKPTEHFLEPPNLPPDEIEMQTTANMKEEKVVIVEKKETKSTKGRQRNKKKNTKQNVANNELMLPPGKQSVGMYTGPPGFQSQQQHIGQSIPNRPTNSKVALGTMLRSRNPTASGVSNPGLMHMMKRSMIRQPMIRMSPEQAPLYAGPPSYRYTGYPSDQPIVEYNQFGNPGQQSNFMGNPGQYSQGQMHPVQIQQIQQRRLIQQQMHQQRFMQQMRQQSRPPHNASMF